MAITRSDILRRVIVPAALVVVLGLVTQKTCTGQERAEVRFALDFGDEPARIRHVRVDLWAGDTSIGFAEHEYGDAGADGPRVMRWRQVVPQAELDATIALTLQGGEVVAHRRRVHAVGGAEIIIDASP
ncbi:MAG: hypothetical protein H6708_24995 [Kofleriaceae bacterium]|nr:hypothetical protein [Kofleriaceae bacterium]